jgi:hypothetical protein
MIEESQMVGNILLAKPIDPNEITAVIHGALAARPEPFGSADPAYAPLDDR